jgi:hypothetical protein
MGFFRKKEGKGVGRGASDVVGSIAPAAKDLGVVIHVMPRDFLGAEAALRVEPALPPVAPVLAPVPKSAAAMPPSAQKVRILPPKRTVPMWTWVVILILILFAAAAVGYVVLGKAQQQAVQNPIVEVVQPPVVQDEPVVETPVEEPVDPETG